MSCVFEADLSAITLSRAVEICRELEPALAAIGYHCGLTGSVLYKGSSLKDVDVIVYPHQVTERKSRATIVAALRGVGAIPSYDQSTVGSCRDKDVHVFAFRGLRVDLFFLS